MTTNLQGAIEQFALFGIEAATLTRHPGIGTVAPASPIGGRPSGGPVRSPGIKAKKVKADTKVEDIQAPKKKKKKVSDEKAGGPGSGRKQEGDEGWDRPEAGKPRGLRPFDDVHSKKSEVKAGGPGSGRKPEWGHHIIVAPLKFK